MARRLGRLDHLSIALGTGLWCCSSWPTTGRGSLQLPVLHGLGATCSNCAFAPLAAFGRRGPAGYRRYLDRDGSDGACRFKYPHLATERDLARFGETLEPCACR